MKNLLMGDNFLKNGIKILFPQNLRTFFKKELTKLFTSKAKNMSNSIKKELLQYYKKDIQSLEKLINKDLSKWQRI